jgi:hypothetical protein
MVDILCFLSCGNSDLFNAAIAHVLANSADGEGLLHGGME